MEKYMNSNSFSIGYRYSNSLKHNNFFSKIGILFGLIITIVVLSIVNGFKQEIENKLLANIPHAEVVAKYNGQLINYKQYLNDFIIQDNITQAIPFSEVKGFIKSNKSHNKVLITGVDKNYISFYNYELSENCSNFYNQKNTICLGDKLAKSINVNIGDNLKILVNDKTKNKPYYKNFKYIGSFKSETSVNKFTAITIEKNIRDLKYILHAEGIRYKTKTPFNIKDKGYELIKNIPEKVILSTWKQQFYNIYNDLKLIQSLSFIVFFFIVLLSLLNLISNLVINLKQKEQDINIFKSFGYSNKKIKNIFLFSIIINYFKYLLIGLISSIIISYNIDSISLFFGLNDIASFDSLFSTVPSKIDFIQIFYIFVMTLFINIFFVNLTIIKSLKK